MALSKEKIRELLGTGLSNEVVASAVGCDVSYVAQLLADENFASEVSNLRAAALTANTRRDRDIDALEDRLLDKLEDVLDGNQIYKPNDLLRAFAVINNAKRRGVPARESVVIHNTVVNLQLPPAVRRQFTLNSSSEVIEVEGETLVTMPSHKLLKDLAAKGSGDDNAKYEKVANYLPAPAPETGS